MEHYAPKGLLCPLVTPLTPEGKVDELSLKRLIVHVAPYVDGIILGESSMGEGLYIKTEEREYLIKAGMEATNSKVPLIIGITGNTGDETKHYISQVVSLKEELNYNGEIFLMDCPLWYHSNRDLPDYYENLSEICEFPFILCNNPNLIRQLGKRVKRKDIRTSVLKKLSRNEQIVAMEFLGDLKRFFNYQKAVRGRRRFRFYDGNEVEFLNRPSSGGVVAPGANILPQEWQKIVYSSLNIEESRSDYTDQIWTLGHKVWMFQKVYSSNPIAIIKSALKYMGILDTDVVSNKTSPTSPPQRAQIYGLLIENEMAKINKEERHGG
ncbi:MAG TPA: hypothetical protein EYP21_04695 [Syntrophaceae bacterium]|nr:hypothetical protein [Syntrophaceae bacterium]